MTRRTRPLPFFISHFTLRLHERACHAHRRTQRLAAANADKANWRLWGPYLSERQWGTVREDYSATGKAWEYLPHDLARAAEP